LYAGADFRPEWSSSGIQQPPMAGSGLSKRAADLAADICQFVSGRPEYANNGALTRKLDSSGFRDALAGWISQQCGNELRLGDDVIQGCGLSTPAIENSDCESGATDAADATTDATNRHVNKNLDVSSHTSQNKTSVATGGRTKTAGPSRRGTRRHDGIAEASISIPPRQPLPVSRRVDDDDNSSFEKAVQPQPLAHGRGAVSTVPKTPPMSGQSPVQTRTKGSSHWRAAFRAGA
jgi:hypothetical protein